MAREATYAWQVSGDKGRTWRTVVVGLTAADVQRNAPRTTDGTSGSGPADVVGRYVPEV
jgi:hypothetical protein